MEDRHYVCEQCGLKWFVPGTRAARAEELRCGECDARLKPRDDLFAAGDDLLTGDSPLER